MQAITYQVSESIVSLVGRCCINNQTSAGGSTAGRLHKRSGRSVKAAGKRIQARPAVDEADLKDRVSAGK